MLRIGVLGVGHLGKFHLNNWQEIENVVIAGFYDPDDKNALPVEEKYKIKRFFSPEELMDECDAVDIVAPTPLHFNLCEMALKKGKHVFVEKPLALNVIDGEAMIATAKKIKFG